MKGIFNNRASFALLFSYIVGIASLLMATPSCQRNYGSLDKWSVYESQPYGVSEIQIVDSAEITQEIIDELAEYYTIPLIIRSQEDLENMSASGKYKVETLLDHPLSDNDIPINFSNDTCILIYYSLFLRVPDEIVSGIEKNENKPEYVWSIYYNEFQSELPANKQCLIRTAIRSRIPRDSQIRCVKMFSIPQKQ